MRWREIFLTKSQGKRNVFAKANNKESEKKNYKLYICVYERYVLRTLRNVAYVFSVYIIHRYNIKEKNQSSI